MAAGIPLDSARLLAVILGSIFYGLFVALAGAAIYSLATKPDGMHWKLLGTIVTMLVLATVHIIVVIIAAFEAFIEHKRGSPFVYYLNISNPLITLETALFNTQMVIGDAFLIYRCYVIWGRSWYIVILPVLSLLGCAASGYGAVVTMAITPSSADMFMTSVKPWITTSAAMTFVTNFMCTGLIAFKLYTSQRRLQKLPGYKYMQSSSQSALAIMIESAAIWLLSATVFLTVYLLNSNGQYAMLDIGPSLMGITFTAIILRISYGLSSNGTKPPHRHEHLRHPSNKSSALSYTEAYKTNVRQITTVGGSHHRVGDNSEIRSADPLAARVDHFIYESMDNLHGEKAGKLEPVRMV